MTQIKFAFKNIIKEPRPYIILFLQILISFFLVAFLIGVSNTLKNDIGDVKDNGIKDYYALLNRSSALPRGDDMLVRHMELLEYLDSSFEILRFTRYPTWHNNSTMIETVHVNDLFFQHFNISLNKGALFDYVDYSFNPEYIPVILGSSYVGDYELGDTFPITDYTFLAPKEFLGYYRVIGFLKEGSKYYNVISGDLNISLDEMIVLPLFRDYDEMYFDLSLPLLNTLVFSSIINYDDNTKDRLYSINQKSQMLDLYTIEIRSWDESIEYREESMRETYRLISLIFSSIVFFAAMGMVFFLLLFIENNLFLIAVNILCGGTKFSIAKELVARVGIIILVAAFITIAVMKFKLQIMFWILSMSAFNILIISIVPIISVSKMDVSLLLRGRE